MLGGTKKKISLKVTYGAAVASCMGVAGNALQGAAVCRRGPGGAVSRLSAVRALQSCGGSAGCSSHPKGGMKGGCDAQIAAACCGRAFQGATTHSVRHGFGASGIGSVLPAAEGAPGCGRCFRLRKVLLAPVQSVRHT